MINPKNWVKIVKKVKISEKKQFFFSQMKSLIIRNDFQ